MDRFFVVFACLVAFCNGKALAGEPFEEYGLPQPVHRTQDTPTTGSILLPTGRFPSIPKLAPLTRSGLPTRGDEFSPFFKVPTGLELLSERRTLPERREIEKHIPKAPTPFTLTPVKHISSPSSIISPIVRTSPVSSATIPSDGNILLDTSRTPKIPAGVLVSDDRGQYSIGFEEPTGTRVREQGHLISVDGGWEYVVAKEGSYSYTSPEGIPVEVDWIADENGFRIIKMTP